jgi:hypothetical protein
MAHQEAEPDFSEDAWNVEAVFPEMTARDTTKYAAALQQIVTAVGLALDRALLTETTAMALINAIAGRLGVEIDVEAELKAARKKAAKTAEDDVFKDPPDDSADSP